jgi:hypothetical protein
VFLERHDGVQSMHSITRWSGVASMRANTKEEPEDRHMADPVRTWALRNPNRYGRIASLVVVVASRIDRVVRSHVKTSSRNMFRRPAALEHPK